MGKTSIEWTDHSWPVVNGCRRTSPGCENCYAERLSATRLSQTPKYKGLAVMKAPPPKVLRRERRDGSVQLVKLQPPGRPRWTGESRLWVPHLDMPLRLKKPSRIFVADMGDLFYEKVTNEEIAAVFGVMVSCPQHTFQILTKRAARMRDWFEWVREKRGGRGGGFPLGIALDLSAVAGKEVLRWPRAGIMDEELRWPLPNVWLGVSVEDQQRADERIPILLDTPAAIRFVSAEPLLGPVDLRRRIVENRAAGTNSLEMVSGIDWIIVGGESGPGARPFDLAWAAALVDQCAAAGAACFVKQLGSRPTSAADRIGYKGQPRNGRPDGFYRFLNDRKGGDPSEWPEALRVRQFPNERLNGSGLVGPSDARGKQEAPLAGTVKTPGIPAV